MTVNKTFIVKNQSLYFFGQLKEKPPFSPKNFGQDGSGHYIDRKFVCLLRKYK
jgi:hypothetical protein